MDKDSNFGAGKALLLYNLRIPKSRKIAVVEPARGNRLRLNLGDAPEPRRAWSREPVASDTRTAGKGACAEVETRLATAPH